jgi:hypothetical protein
LDSLEEAFKQVQRAFHCPKCGKSYDKKDLQLKGFLNNTYIFKAFCDKNHTATVAECVIFMDQNNMQPLSNKDIADLKQEINGFDGNFEKLFRKK